MCDETEETVMRNVNLLADSNWRDSNWRDSNWRYDSNWRDSNWR